MVPSPEYPIWMPPVADSVRDEFSFMLYGGLEPQDKVWRQWNDSGRMLRRHCTRESPLAFTVVYLLGSMKPLRTEQGKVYSFSEFHLALCEWAKTWMKPDGQRVGIIAPRGVGKSYWTFFALPLWAIAHGHRNFFAGYSHSDKQAVHRLDEIRRELKFNELLQFDFPELAIPTGARDNSHLVNVASGRSFASNGLDAVTLGLRPGKYRPDIKVVDDGEANKSNYAREGSRGDKNSRLDTIRDIVLPMNADAVVVLSGTVVKHGSIGHDLVKSALGQSTPDWVAQERFRTVYWPPILDEGTPRERSIWPEWHSLEWWREERERNPAVYALHYLNRPMTHNGKYWRERDFKFDPHFPLDHYAMYVDPAIMPTPGRDKTAIVAGGADIGRHRAVVQFVKQGHLTMPELAEGIAVFKASRPEIPLLDVYIEKNQGGALWAEHLAKTRPHGVRLHLVHTGAEEAATGERGKLARIASAYAYYQSNGGQVWHERQFPELQELLTAFPEVENDDLPDALAGFLRAVFEPSSHRCTAYCT